MEQRRKKISGITLTFYIGPNVAIKGLDAKALLPCYNFKPEARLIDRVCVPLRPHNFI